MSSENAAQTNYLPVVPGVSAPLLAASFGSRFLGGDAVPLTG
jgi:hypothetical protein